LGTRAAASVGELFDVRNGYPFLKLLTVGELPMEIVVIQKKVIRGLGREARSPQADQLIGFEAAQQLDGWAGRLVGSRELLVGRARLRGTHCDMKSMTVTTHHRLLILGLRFWALPWRTLYRVFTAKIRARQRGGNAEAGYSSAPGVPRGGYPMVEAKAVELLPHGQS